VAPVQHNNSFDERQPDLSAAFRTIQRAIGLCEEIEDARQEFFRETDAGISNSNDVSSTSR
jgi:hypothetical protein